MRTRLLCLFLLTALGAFAAPAYANRDIVQFGSRIRVAPDQTVHDTVCFFCSVENHGTIEGDTVVFFGNVTIEGHNNHDVVNFFGNIHAADNSTIGHDMVSIFGNVHLGENVSVGKDLVAIFGGLHAASTVNVGGDRVVQPGWVFWGPFLIFGLVVILIVREFRNHRRRAFMQYPMPPPPPAQ